MIEKIRQCMAKAMKLDEAVASQLDLQTTAADLAGWTSVAHLSLVLELEKAFGVRIGNDEIASLGSVSAIVSSLTGKGVSQ